MEAKEEFIALRWNSRRDPHVSNSFTPVSFYSRKVLVLSQHRTAKKNRTRDMQLLSMKEASSQLFLFAKDGKKRQPASRSVVVVYARGSNTGHGIVVFSFLLSTTTFLFTTDLAAVRGVGIA